MVPRAGRVQSAVAQRIAEYRTVAPQSTEDARRGRQQQTQGRHVAGQDERQVGEIAPRRVVFEDRQVAVLGDVETDVAAPARQGPPAAGRTVAARGPAAGVVAHGAVAVERPPAGPAGAPGQVQVLVEGKVALVEDLAPGPGDLLEHRAAVESGRAADAEHLGVGVETAVVGTAVATVVRLPRARQLLAGGVEGPSVESEQLPGDHPDLGVVERRDQLLEEPRLELGVGVEDQDERARRSGEPDVVGATEPDVGAAFHHLHVGEHAVHEGRRAVRRPAVDDDDLGRRALETREAVQTVLDPA